jgi:hypothetical protein
VLKNANWQDFALVEDRVDLANLLSDGDGPVPLDGAGLAAAFRERPKN